MTGKICLNVLLVFNPVSGSYSRQLLDCLASEFGAQGHSISLIDSWQIGFAAELVCAELVCVVGGDGTLRDVIAQLEGHANLPVCIYPAGTINLIAREVGYMRHVSRFVTRVTAGFPCRSHYFGSIDSKPFLACASVGPDSLAVAAVSVGLKQRIGRFAYVVSFIRLLWSWPQMDLRVSANSRIYQCEAAFVLKGRFFAGPWTLASQANLCAPEFHLLLLPQARRRDYLQLLLYAMLGSYFESSAWKRLRCTDVKIDSNVLHPVQADGDIAANLPVHFVMQNIAVRFA